MYGLYDFVAFGVLFVTVMEWCESMTAVVSALVLHLSLERQRL